MKKLIFLLLLFVVAGCGIFNTEPVPKEFKANVKFEVPVPKNINEDTGSIKTKIGDNNGKVQKNSFIWVSFADEINNEIPFRIPYPTKWVGIKLIRTESDSVFDFDGWINPEIIDFRKNTNDKIFQH